jgi:hypothetical protein
VYKISEDEELSVYFSNGGYMTTDGNTHFVPLVMGNVSVSEKLSREGNVSMSVGDIAVNNSDGRFDEYLGTDYVWVNRPITVYYGDPSWNAADISEIQAGTIFNIAFTGIIADISSSGNDTINFKLRDKLERLNTPISDGKIGTYGTWAGGQQNQDAFSPLVFGEVHNMTPILIDPSTLEYRFNTGSSERLIEVRDNGIPITALTENLTDGTFKLHSPAYGTLTCSVQGVKKSVNLGSGAALTTYNNNIANLVAMITTQYGSNADNRLTSSELDLTSLGAFAGNTEYVGIPITDRQNVLAVCQQLVASIGGQLYMTRQGKLGVLRFGTTISGSGISAITELDIVKDSISIAERIPVTAATKIGYCKNYTVQQGLQTAIPDAHKEMFALEWYSVTSENSTVKTRYKLEADPVQKDTLLLKSTDASTEAARLNGLYTSPRTIYRFTGTPRLMGLVLGQSVTLTHSRFSLSSGASGQVVGLNINWAQHSVEVEVLV